MATRTVVTGPNRHLPASIPKKAERAGYRILRALDRLGIVHNNEDGSVFTVRFDKAVVYDGRWLVLGVDAQRLWHFSVKDLTRTEVVETLEAVCKWPVRVLREDIHGRRGIYYVVDLAPRRNGDSSTSKPKLPTRADLDLSTRPEGDLMVPIGRSADGDMWEPLPKVGHTLIVGATDTGKSTLTHSMLAGLLTANGPDKLQVTIFDQKRSEFPMWKNVPHLWNNIAYTEDESVKLLQKLVDECNRRGEVFGKAMTRDIKAYNRHADRPMPYLLVVIDEILDLVSCGGKKVNESLKSLAIRGRSAGVLLWASTQHAAAVDGLPRVVNVNLLTRLVFRVLDESAAKSAGCKGAVDLPVNHRGRMLARIKGSKPEMLQALYLDDERLLEIALGLGKKSEQQEPPRPTLPTGVEKALLIWAIAEKGGYLTQKDVERVGGFGQREARRMLARFREERGWLFKDPSARNAHRVTDETYQLVGMELRA